MNSDTCRLHPCISNLKLSISLGSHGVDVRVFHKECKSLARSGKHVVLIVPHPRDEVVDSVEVKGIQINGGRLFE